MICKYYNVANKKNLLEIPLWSVSLYQTPRFVQWSLMTLAQDSTENTILNQYFMLNKNNMLGMDNTKYCCNHNVVTSTRYERYLRFMISRPVRVASIVSPAAAHFADSPLTSIAKRIKKTMNKVSKDQIKKRYEIGPTLPFTVPVCSPGITMTVSPTWIVPASTLPATEIPPPPPLLPLKKSATPNRNGLSKSLTGGSNASIPRNRSCYEPDQL